MKEKELEKILKALASRRRLAILKFLKHNREAAVNEIARAIKLSFKSTSKHLSILKAMDIVEHDQRGLLMFYSLSDSLRPMINHWLNYL